MSRSDGSPRDRPAVEDSVAAIRAKDPEGHVALLDVATTEPGSILGIALLADSSPASTHDHRHGQRLVTASLSVQIRGDLAADPPARGHIDKRLGDWPFIAGSATIVGASGADIASSYTTFVGLDPSTRPSGQATGPADGTIAMPRLDDLAGSIVEAIRAGRSAADEDAVWSTLVLDRRLRNRFGVIHGASVYTVLALLACEVPPPSVAVRILDSHVRFLRPITRESVTLEASVIARSRRFIDVDARIRAADEDLLAIGSFMLGST